MKTTEKSFRKYETYALVTGAASGMGRLYAIELAKIGYNLILVDINEEKLAATVREVKEAMKLTGSPDSGSHETLDILSVTQDLAQTDAAAKVAEASEGRQVEVLVNNAGIMYFQRLTDTSRKALSLIMTLHMHTPLMLCREFVPKMQERGCGYVLNISSLAAWMAWPGIGMYGNTKRFVKGFSRQLRIECRGTGVSVTNAYFGAVDTPLVPLSPKYRKIARAIRVMIPAEKAVEKALKATFRRRKGITPGLVNKVAIPIVNSLPDIVLAWMLKVLGPILMNV